MNQLEQKPLVPITLEDFSSMDFFNRVTVNMTSCTKLEHEEDGDEENQENSPKVDDKTVTILEAILVARMGWR